VNSRTGQLATTLATVVKAYKLFVDNKNVKYFVGGGKFARGESRLNQLISTVEDTSIKTL